MRLRFTGIIPESVSSLTLKLRGGLELVGPFVFNDVRVVSEYANGETPQAPGDPTEGTATPASATE